MRPWLCGLQLACAGHALGRLREEASCLPPDAYPLCISDETTDAALLLPLAGRRACPGLDTGWHEATDEEPGSHCACRRAPLIRPAATFSPCDAQGEGRTNAVLLLSACGDEEPAPDLIRGGEKRRVRGRAIATLAEERPSSGLRPPSPRAMHREKEEHMRLCFSPLAGRSKAGKRCGRAERGRRLTAVGSRETLPASAGWAAYSWSGA